jgi:hypothetical protein
MPEQAYAVETYVEEERGQWVVDIVVIFEDEAIRRRVNTFRTERRARIAAEWIKRAAQRDIKGPLNG